MKEINGLHVISINHVRELLTKKEMRRFRNKYGFDKRLKKFKCPLCNEYHFCQNTYTEYAQFLKLDKMLRRTTRSDI